MQIMFSLYIPLYCDIQSRDSNHAGDVLNTKQMTWKWYYFNWGTWYAVSFSTLTLPSPPWAWPTLNTHGKFEKPFCHKKGIRRIMFRRVYYSELLMFVIGYLPFLVVLGNTFVRLRGICPFQVYLEFSPIGRKSKVGPA